MPPIDRYRQLTAGPNFVTNIAYLLAHLTRWCLHFALGVIKVANLWELWQVTFDICVLLDRPPSVLHIFLPGPIYQFCSSLPWSKSDKTRSMYDSRDSRKISHGVDDNLHTGVTSMAPFLTIWVHHFLWTCQCDRTARSYHVLLQLIDKCTAETMLWEA